MKRRHFLRAMMAGVLTGWVVPEALAKTLVALPPTNQETFDNHIKDYLHKLRNFSKHHQGDFYLDRNRYGILRSSLKRLKRLQRTVGYGNFYLLSFDDAIKFARNYSRVGRFPKGELNFLEMIFYEDGARYGFFGYKPIRNLTDRIKKREVVKIPRTGNYVYKGLPLSTYKKIKGELGNQVVLTSGVRSIMKQFLLFLNKAYKSKGNLSLASRSLAPPGYSFHAVGDFDVGQAGFGVANFSARFTTTKVFKRLQDLGYVNLRYPRDNLLGVRFEPWHIKVDWKI